MYEKLLQVAGTDIKWREVKWANRIKRVLLYYAQTTLKEILPLVWLVNQRIDGSGEAQRVQQHGEVLHGLSVGLRRAALACVGARVAPHTQPPARERYAQVQDFCHFP